MPLILSVEQAHSSKEVPNSLPAKYMEGSRASQYGECLRGHSAGMESWRSESKS